MQPSKSKVRIGVSMQINRADGTSIDVGPVDGKVMFEGQTNVQRTDNIFQRLRSRWRIWKANRDHRKRERLKP